MLIYVAAGMGAVCDRLEQLEVLATVGPESGSGWTVAWVDTDRSDLLLEAFDVPLMLVGGDDAAGLRLRPGDGDPALVTWPGGTAARELAMTLGALFDRPEAVDELSNLVEASHRDRLDLLLDRLTPLLGLPVQPSAATGRSVVLCHGDRDGIRMAAAILGPAWLLDVGTGWTVVQRAVQEEVGAGGDAFSGEAFAAGLSGGRGHRHRTVLLWEDGRTAGVQVWRRGEVVADWSWGADLRLVVPDPQPLEAVVTAELAKVAGGEVNLPSIRALLRRSASAEDPLGELVDLIRLPAGTRNLLDEGLETAGAELVRESSVLSAVRGAVEAQRGRPVSPRWRPAYVVHAAFTVCAAVVVVAMTALGVTERDWPWVGVFALLTVLIVPAAVRRVRRLSRT